jgi:diguanylate cyclase (GGDEF)-like protein
MRVERIESVRGSNVETNAALSTVGGMKPLDYLERFSVPVTLALGLLLVLLVGLVDYITGSELSFAIFYFAPVALVAWSKGRFPGLLIAFVSAAVLLIADLLSDRVYPYHLIPYWNCLVRLGMFVVIALVFARLKVNLDGEKRAARVDALTGVLNSRGFFERAEYERSRAERYGYPLVVAYMDVDDFKTLNDTRGHDVGDAALAVVAGTIRRTIRTNDVAGRLGGDEFAFLLPDTSHRAAQAMTQRLKANLDREMEKNGWPVTFSIGVVTYSPPPASVREMVRAADELMYRVKNRSKNAAEHRLVEGEAVRSVSRNLDEPGNLA